MNIKSRSISIRFEHQILSIYAVCVFLYAIMQSNISIQFPIVKSVMMGSFVALLILGVFFSLKHKTTIRKKDAMLLAAFLILLLYNILNNGFENGTIFIIPFCYLLMDCKIENILKKYSKSTFLAILFVILLCKIGILNNQTFTNAATTFKVRQGLGFIWTTFAPNMFLSAVLAFVSYRKGKINLIELLLLFFVNLYLYSQTKTLAAFLCVLLCLICVCLFKSSKVQQFCFSNKFFEFIFNHFAIIVAIFTILFQLYYNAKVNGSVMLNALNRATSFRLGLGQVAFENYKITFLGQWIEWNQGTNQNYFYLDSSYLSILFNNGIVMLLFICLLMDIVGKYGMKVRNYFLVTALSIFLIHCITDPQLIDFRNNPFYMIVLQCFFYLRQSKKNNV